MRSAVTAFNAETAETAERAENEEHSGSITVMLFKANVAALAGIVRSACSARSALIVVIVRS
jgi:hypothetical protein